MSQLGICWKCNGSGFLEKYSHIQNGKCFACGGDGIVSESDIANGGNQKGRKTRLLNKSHKAMDSASLKKYRGELMDLAKEIGIEVKAGESTESLIKKVQGKEASSTQFNKKTYLETIGSSLSDGKVTKSQFGNSLMPPEDVSGRTAIKRTRGNASDIVLSNPSKILTNNGLLKKGVRTLNFGSGRGEDTEKLNAEGYNLVNYDVNHARNPLNIVEPYKQLMSNYVLNVIPTQFRPNALKLLAGLVDDDGTAFISVRSVGDNDYKTKKDTWEKSGDGLITGTGTFQKFYDEKELERELGDYFENIEFVKMKSSAHGILVKVSGRKVPKVSYSEYSKLEE